jgi:hypothetical protein
VGQRIKTVLSCKFLVLSGEKGEKRKPEKDKDKDKFKFKGKGKDRTLPPEADKWNRRERHLRFIRGFPVIINGIIHHFLISVVDTISCISYKTNSFVRLGLYLPS